MNLHCAYLIFAYRLELLRDQITLPQPIIVQKYAKNRLTDPSAS